MEKNSILMKNEIEANKFASIVMMITNLFVVIVYVLNYLRIFVAPANLMSIAMISSAVLLTMPFVIIIVLKQQGLWIKYVTVTAAIFMVTILATLLSYHVVVMFAFPLAISSLFFSRRLSWYTSITSIVFLSGAQILTLLLKGVPDHNLEDMYSVLVYGIAPELFNW